MKKMLGLLFLHAVVFSLFFLVYSGVAKGQVGQADMLGTEIGASAGLTSADPRLMVALIIKWVMGLMGMVALIIFLYSGFEWMTSMGNDQKVGDAKKRIWYAVIGMVVLLSAYAITMFVFKTVYLVTDARI